MNYDYLIVGAGFAGSVCAERLANAGKTVLIIDKRTHIGGNAFDKLDVHGVLIHEYGPHIFHTNSERIFLYLSNFTDWRPYEHRVRAYINGQLLPIPINQETINRLYNLDLDEAGVKLFLESARVPIDHIKTSEDVVLNCVGRDLCEKFFRGYTKKQWDLDLSQLSAGVAARIPTRTNMDDRYFNDTFQAMPANGYTAIFERMLSNENIETKLGIDFFEIRDQYADTHVIYTGPLDAYFNYCYGKLPYRSLEFVHEHHGDINKYQDVGTINYPNDYAYTRITEYKHLTGQVVNGTSITKEIPRAEGDPYYPIPRPENEKIYKQYQALADNEPNTTFIGRLAQYKYYNMDQVVGAAISAAEVLLTHKVN